MIMLLGLCVLLGGCASYDTEVERGHSLAGVQRYFVVSNLNDNHALDRQIAGALKARGFEAETGPLTMMPIGTQAIVTFEDRWDWDFGDHLLYLRLTVHENRLSRQLLSTATFSARIPLREATSVTVGALVGRLFPAKP
jgi:hypothetical protein